MALDVSYGAAVGAGVLSFLSPCVLPLVPFYLVFISGVSLDDLKRGEAGANKSAIPAAIAFVLGFTTVFVALGASASYIGQVVRDELPLLAKIAGVFIILMGLNFLGVFKLGFLSKKSAIIKKQSRWACLALMPLGWLSPLAGRPASGQCWQQFYLWRR